MHRAGFWIRTLAAVIDLVAFLPVYIVAIIAMTAVSQRVGNARGQWIGASLIDALWLIYSSFEIWTSATPGKLLLRLRIRANDGSAADFWRKFLRWSTKQYWWICSVLWLLSGFVPFYVLGGFISGMVLVGCLAAADDDHLSWHDQWAGTAVYRRRRERPAMVASQFAVAEPAPPTG